jgi:hypothetical protein
MRIIDVIEQIYNHQRIHRGESPEVIILHPENVHQIREELIEEASYVVTGDMRIQGIPVYRSHDIEIDTIVVA